MDPYNKPFPRINDDNRDFWDGCSKHELRFQKCCSCNHVRWPAALICPKCHSKETTWIISSGKGKLYTYAVYHIAYHNGFKSELPYVVGVVELEEGPRFLSNIVECDSQNLKCDMKMEVIWEDISQDISLPKFRPLLNP